VIDLAPAAVSLAHVDAAPRPWSSGPWSGWWSAASHRPRPPFSRCRQSCAMPSYVSLTSGSAVPRIRLGAGASARCHVPEVSHHGGGVGRSWRW